MFDVNTISHDEITFNRKQKPIGKILPMRYNVTMDKLGDRFWFQGYIFEDILELARHLGCNPRKAIIKAVRFYLAELRKTG